MNEIFNFGRNSTRDVIRVQPVIKHYVMAFTDTGFYISVLILCFSKTIHYTKRCCETECVWQGKTTYLHLNRYQDLLAIRHTDTNFTLVHARINSIIIRMDSEPYALSRTTSYAKRSRRQ